VPDAYTSVMIVKQVCLVALFISGPYANSEGTDTATQSEAAISAQVSAYLQKTMPESHTPGVSFAVVKDERIVQDGAYGLANVETGAPTSPETIYKVASLRKAFLAAATLMLVQDNKLQLDAKACTFLERCPEAWKEITVLSTVDAHGRSRTRSR